MFKRCLVGDDKRFAKFVSAAAFGASVAATGSAISWPASAAEEWYGNLSAGVSLMDDADSSGRLLTLSNSFDAGPVVLGSVGWNSGKSWRLEGEVSYRKNDLSTFDSVAVAGLGAATGLNLAAAGDVTSFGFLLNAAYDFNTGSNWTPYLMAGIGFAHIKVNDAKIVNVRVADDSDTVFAYQIGAGIDYKIGDKWSVGLSYRYFAAADPSFTAVDRTEFDSEYSTHNILAGVTLKF